MRRTCEARQHAVHAPSLIRIGQVGHREDGPLGVGARVLLALLHQVYGSLQRTSKHARLACSKQGLSARVRAAGRGVGRTSSGLV